MHYRSVIVASLFASLMHGAVFAEDYFNITYLNDYPDRASMQRLGTLQLEPDALRFCFDPGSCLTVPYGTIQDNRGQSQTKQRRMFGLAGPNPILLGASLGLMALQNARSKPGKASYYNLISYLDPTGARQYMSLLVPSEAVQRQIMNKIAYYVSSPASREHFQNPSVTPQGLNTSHIIPLPRPEDDPGSGVFE